MNSQQKINFSKAFLKKPGKRGTLIGIFLKKHIPFYASAFNKLTPFALARYMVGLGEETLKNIVDFFSKKGENKLAECELAASAFNISYDISGKQWKQVKKDYVDLYPNLFVVHVENTNSKEIEFIKKIINTNEIFIVIFNGRKVVMNAGEDLINVVSPSTKVYWFNYLGYLEGDPKIKELKSAMSRAKSSGNGQMVGNIEIIYSGNNSFQIKSNGNSVFIKRSGGHLVFDRCEVRKNIEISNTRPGDFKVGKLQSSREILK